jgi:hypothetical protein
LAVRTTRANSRPVTIASSPGTMNAARQPANSVSAPVISAAPATPMLPYTPLTPSARPERAVLCTTSAVPTG